LILIFLPSGYYTGYGIGLTIRTADGAAAMAVLSAPLAAILSIGLLYSLGAGVTAHASEFDFFLTADVRPRKYLLADLVFQRGRLPGGHRPRVAPPVERVYFPRHQADDVRRFRPGGPRFANGDPAAHHRAFRRCDHARPAADGSRQRDGPHDPIPSGPDLAGREHPVRRVLRPHRDPPRRPRRHRDRRSPGHHGHPDPHLLARHPRDELGLLRAGESVDPPQRRAITRRLLPRLDAQLRDDRPRDDRGVPGPHRPCTALRAPHPDA